MFEPGLGRLPLVVHPLSFCSQVRVAWATKNCVIALRQSRWDLAFQGQLNHVPYCRPLQLCPRWWCLLRQCRAWRRSANSERRPSRKKWDGRLKRICDATLEIHHHQTSIKQSAEPLKNIYGVLFLKNRINSLSRQHNSDDSSLN